MNYINKLAGWVAIVIAVASIFLSVRVSNDVSTLAANVASEMSQQAQGVPGNTSPSTQYGLATTFLPSIGVDQLSISQNCHNAYVAGYNQNINNCNDITSYRLPFTAATTSMPCSAPTPTVSSILWDASILVTGPGSSTAGFVSIATSSNPNSTSTTATMLSSTAYTPATSTAFTFDAGTNNSFLLGTTSTTTYVGFNLVNQAASTSYAVSGVCTYTFETIN